MQQPGRWLRCAAWVVAILAVLVGAAFWGLPALLLSQLPPRLSEVLGRPVTLQAVEFVPWRLALTLRGLRIGAAGEPAAGAASPAAVATAPALLQVERLHADLSLASLRHRAPVVEALEIDGLRLNLARTAAGHYDFDDLIERFKPRPEHPPVSEPAHFSLNNLALRGAQIRFDDRPVGRLHTVQGLTLTLPFLSNLPSDVAIRTEPRLAFSLNGTRFDTGSQALPFAATRSGDLTLKFADLDLQPWLGYLPAGLPVQLQAARLSSDLALRFALPPSGVPSVSVQGRLAVNDLKLAEPGGAPLAGWQALSLDLVEMQPLVRQLKLGLLQFDGAHLQLSRNAQGQFNWQRLLAPKAGTQPLAATATLPAPSAANAASSAATPWAISLASFKFNRGQVRWIDDAVKPQAALQVDDLSVTLDGLRWPAPAPLPLSASAVLRGQRDGAAPAGRVNLTGQANDRQAALTLTLAELDLVALSPYLAQALRPRVSGQLAAQAQLNWAAEPAVLTVKLVNARLQDLQLRDGAAPRAPRLASLRDLQLAAVDADLLARRLSIGSVTLVQPVIALSRDAAGVVNLQQWAAAPGTAGAVSASASAASANPNPAAAATLPARPTPPAAASTAAAWRIALQDLSISDGQLQWRDARAADVHTGEAVRADVSGLRLRLQGLVWPAPAQAGAALPRLQVTARLSVPAEAGVAPALGDIDWKGRVGLAPLQADGQLQVRRFPLHLLVPYAGDALPVSLLHADASFQGKLRLRAADTGWQVATDGDVQLAELQVNARPEPGRRADSGDVLLTWQSLTLQGLSMAMAPPARPQLAVREATLNDFYARLIVTERGRLNLQDVAIRQPAEAAAAGASTTATGAASASASASASTDTAGASVAAGARMDLDIGGILLRNGRVDFSDRFVRPNYSARLTELNGQVGRLRSGTREMAPITLRGRAADTALLDISGAFNPTAQPLALDIRARATDLELAPLSPYAGKYAGYAIERGKLSMDVSYKIDADGKLEASNQVILNQLTFGERVVSPNATQLPVLLAVALLTDRSGVIDINLPVGGSVNDPKFSVGGIVWKVILNLLGKALTAPFSMFAGAGTSDLSVVEFQAGTARLASAGEQSLAKVASALAERPALMMTVTGAADPVSERAEAQQAELEDRLQAERRSELLRAAPAGAAAAAAVVAPTGVAATSAPAGVAASARASPASVLPADDRNRLLKRLYQQTPLPDKPRNALGLLRDLPPAEMEALLLAHILVTEDTMRELALQRGLAVRDALMAAGLPSERLLLAAPRLRLSGEGDAAWVPKVQLTLATR